MFASHVDAWFFLFLIEISVTILLRNDFCGTVCVRVCVCLCFSGELLNHFCPPCTLTSGNIGINYNVEIFILGPNSRDLS